MYRQRQPFSIPLVFYDDETWLLTAFVDATCLLIVCFFHQTIA
jgi:hypothetical protein